MSKPRIVVLTGVTRGLGRAMLKELVAAGRTVAGCGRNTGHIETLRRDYPAPHRFASIDSQKAVATQNSYTKSAD